MVERDRARDQRNEAEHVGAGEDAEANHLPDRLKERREAALVLARRRAHHLEDLPARAPHDEAGGVGAAENPGSKIVAVEGPEEVEEVSVPLPPSVDTVLDRHIAVPDRGGELAPEVTTTLEDESTS